MAPSVNATTEERHPFPLQHQTNNSSSSSSVITVQRSGSVGAGRSSSRPPVALQNANINTHAPKAASNFSKPSLISPERRRPSTSHRRSNSIGGLTDGVGNLNRWSQSTTSSKESPAHTRSNSFSRRMSFGGPGGFTFGLNPSQNAEIESPKKLQKPRSTVNIGDPQARKFEGLESKSNLPPIITLQTLHRTANEKTSPNTAVTASPSTAALLSAAVRSTVPDYFGKEWEDSITQNPILKSRSPLESTFSTSALPAKVQGSSSPERRQRQESETAFPRGHSRNRSQVGKSSSGTLSSDKSKDRASKQPSQKAMLSKALQKANTAVLLDNAQNFEGAMQAYSEACNLLQQVMLRSSGDEDKRKLEAIRNTYTSRIVELEKIAPHLTDDGKALPARPESMDFKEADLISPVEDSAMIGTATMTRIVNDKSYSHDPRSGQLPNMHLPRRRDSLLPSPFDSSSYDPLNITDQYPPRTYSRSPMRDRVVETNVNLAPPMDKQYMPPPLSPRPLASPADERPSTNNDGLNKTGASRATGPSMSPEKTHRREASNESMSWLDTIDESGSSTASSIHSRTSSLGVRRKHIRTASGATEAEFDAALDAAVEAAYDEGFEPAEEPERTHGVDEYDDELANVRRRVEKAKERVRQTERETAIQLARDREKSRVLQERNRPQSIEAEYEGNESEEEERMLEEMTRGYVLDDFEFGLQSKSALPRESDSSGFSGRTWNSSIGSNPTTAGTSLSTVTETSIIPVVPVLSTRTPAPTYPPPAQALPLPPKLNTPLVHAQAETQRDSAPGISQGVRSRRLSGQNAKQLKIETASRPFQPLAGPLTLPSSMAPREPPTDSVPKISSSAGVISQEPHGPSNAQDRPSGPQFARQPPSPFPGPSPIEFVSLPTPTLPHNLTQDSDNGVSLPRSGSPGRPQSRAGLRKNYSSSSLKNLKSRNLSVSNPIDDGQGTSPSTAMSNQFGASMANTSGKPPAMPTLPTPIATAFREKMNGIPTGGLYLFDGDIHSPESPASPGMTGNGGPIPLEPCPTEHLLRPFWLMRALYQTIAHPKGGYLSNKLFVPRDVWRVKGVKIKAVEDKVAVCDFLTAALQKLAKVDNCDADAVLDEMQALEGVLEQMQTTLTRKLGSEVGVQGSGMLFKDAPAAGEIENTAANSKTQSQLSKSSSFSWRRLRSKNSAAALTTGYAGKIPSTEAPKEGISMTTVPMTTLATIRFAKRDLSQVQLSGPNENYMGALARLFDAAQVIDQIARQVVDPGLRHADKTQVGLELSTRHAAEFFGFYICRFVLTDIGVLLDKFIKRGSEWVLV